METLCLMSFMGSGGGALLYLLAAIFYTQAQDIILRFSSAHTTEMISPIYFFLLSLLFVTSLFGVWSMWRLQRKGYFVYVAAQVMILLYPLIWLGKPAFSAVAVIFTSLFVAVYSFQYRHLRKTAEAEAESGTLEKPFQKDEPSGS